jgi:hypothetical protein
VPSFGRDCAGALSCSGGGLHWMGFLGALGAAAGCAVPRTRKDLVAYHGVLAPASGQRCVLWANNEPEGLRWR